MTDDRVSRVDSLMVLLNMERKKSMSLGKHIEKLEAELHGCFHRIEELQTALRAIVELGFWDGDRAMGIARKALEGKDD